MALPASVMGSLVASTSLVRHSIFAQFQFNNKRRNSALRTRPARTSRTTAHPNSEKLSKGVPAVGRVPRVTIGLLSFVKFDLPVATYRELVQLPVVCGQVGLS